jgi:hypothetical protein
MIKIIVALAVVTSQCGGVKKSWTQVLGRPSSARNEALIFIYYKQKWGFWVLLLLRYFLQGLPALNAASTEESRIDVWVPLHRKLLVSGHKRIRVKTANAVFSYLGTHRVEIGIGWGMHEVW